MRLFSLKAPNNSLPTDPGSNEPYKNSSFDPDIVRKRLIMILLISSLQLVSMVIMRQNAPLYLQSIDASEFFVGIVVSAFAFIPLLICVPGGILMDRIGYRKIIAFGAGSMIVSSLILMILPPPGIVVLTQLLAGLSNILVILAAQAYVSNMDHPVNRTRNFALWSLAFGFGLLAGPPIAGILADLWGFRAAFFGAAIVSALVLLVNTRLAEVAPGYRESLNWQGLTGLMRRELPQVSRVSRDLIQKPLVQLAIGISVVVLFVITLRMSFYLVYLEQVEFSSTRIGVLVATQEGFALLFRPFLAPMIHRIGALPLMIGSLILGGIGIGSVAFLQDFTPLFIAAMLTGITPAFTQPISMILMAQSAPDDIQGTAMGLRQMANQAPLFVGPLFFGAVSALFGLHQVFLVAAVMLFISAGFLFLMRHYLVEAYSIF